MDEEKINKLNNNSLFEVSFTQNDKSGTTNLYKIYSNKYLSMIYSEMKGRYSFHRRFFLKASRIERISRPYSVNAIIIEDFHVNTKQYWVCDSNFYV